MNSMGMNSMGTNSMGMNSLGFNSGMGMNSGTGRNPYATGQPSYISKNPMSQQAYGSFNMLSPLGGSGNAYDIFSTKKELCCNGSHQKRIACGQSLFGTSRHNCKRVGCCFDEENYACFKSQPKNCELTEEQKKAVMQGIDTYQSGLDPHSTALPFIEKMQAKREEQNKMNEEKDDLKDRRVLDVDGKETAERTTDIAPMEQRYIYDFFGRKRNAAPTQATVQATVQAAVQATQSTQNRGFFSWFGRRNTQTTQAPYVAPTPAAIESFQPTQPVKVASNNGFRSYILDDRWDQPVNQKSNPKPTDFFNSWYNQKKNPAPTQQTYQQRPVYNQNHVAAAATVQPSHCVDNDANCRFWPSYCETNNYVQENCRKTCDLSCSAQQREFVPTPRPNNVVAVNKKMPAVEKASPIVERAQVLEISQATGIVNLLPEKKCVDTHELCESWTVHCGYNQYVQGKCPITCNIGCAKKRDYVVESVLENVPEITFGQESIAKPDAETVKINYQPVKLAETTAKQAEATTKQAEITTTVYERTTEIVPRYPITTPALVSTIKPETFKYQAPQITTIKSPTFRKAESVFNSRSAATSNSETLYQALARCSQVEKITAALDAELAAKNNAGVSSTAPCQDHSDRCEKMSPYCDDNTVATLCARTCNRCDLSKSKEEINAIRKNIEKQASKKKVDAKQNIEYLECQKIKETQMACVDMLDDDECAGYRSL